MSLPLISDQKESLILAMVERVQASMESVGAIVAFDGNCSTAYEQLMEQLIKVFDGLMKSNRPKLNRLLYRVDISEALLNKWKLRHPNAGVTNIIAHLVIEREFQKVLSRKHFSG